MFAASPMTSRFRSTASWRRSDASNASRPPAPKRSTRRARSKMSTRKIRGSFKAARPPPARKRRFTHDIYLATEQVSEVLAERHLVEETPPPVETNQQVDVATGICVTPQYGTEDPYIPRPIPGREGEHLGAPAPQRIECQRRAHDSLSSIRPKSSSSLDRSPC